MGVGYKCLELDACLLLYLDEAMQTCFAVRDHDVDAKSLDDVGDRVAVEVPVNRGVENAKYQAGEVGAGALGRVLQVQQNTRLLNCRVKDGSDFFHIGENLLVTPLGVSIVHLAEKKPLRVLAHTLFQHIAQGISRKIHNLEHVIGPLQTDLVGTKVFQKIRSPGDIEVIVP